MKPINAALNVQNLSVTLNGKPVLRNISFDVPDCALTAALGPNGAGKSVLLKTMIGLERAAGGSVLVGGGRPLEKLSGFQRARLAGYLSGEQIALPKVTALEAVLMASLTSGFATVSAGEKERAASCLQDVGLAGFERSVCVSFSAGQKQALLLARLLMQDPKILLLDEPFSHLDLEREEALFQLLVKISAKKTVFIVSHNLSYAARFSDFMLVLASGGAESFFGPVSQIFTAETLNRAWRSSRYVIGATSSGLQIPELKP